MSISTPAMEKAEREYNERQALLARHEAGATQAELAYSERVSPAAISRRISRARAERRRNQEDQNAT